MATKQNGVLGSYTPTVTPYTNGTVEANAQALTGQEFHFTHVLGSDGDECKDINSK